MSQSTFRTAFWTMLLAFGLTVVLTGFSPEDFQFARKQILPSAPVAEESDSGFETHSDFPEEGTREVAELAPPPLPVENLLTAKTIDLDVVETSPSPEIPTTASPAPTAHAANAQSPAHTSTPLTAMASAPPVQVASADPDVRLPVSSQDPLSVVSSVPAAGSFPYPELGSVTGQTVAAPQEFVPVPEPLQRHPATTGNVHVIAEKTKLNHEISELRYEVLAMQLQEAQRELRHMRESTESEVARELKSEIKRLRVLIDELQPLPATRQIEQATASTPPQRTASVPIHATQPAPELIAPVQVMESTPPAKRPVVEVTRGSRDGRFNFRFQNVPLPEVFEILGRHANRRVVIEPEVDGDFSGELIDMEPNEAFVKIIKLHKLGVNAKGDYLLVRQFAGQR